jgi:hypothetical protein
MSYRTNPTDKQQNEIEAAAFEGGAPVFAHGKTKVIAKGLQTAPQKTTHGTGVGAQRNNAGTILPHDDAPNRFVSETQGRA